jgi:hypothetical protein
MVHVKAKRRNNVLIARVLETQSTQQSRLGKETLQLKTFFRSSRIASSKILFSKIINVMCRYSRGYRVDGTHMRGQ